LYAKPFQLVTEIAFRYCTTPPCHKINLFKRPFWGSRFERFDDAFVQLISFMFLYLQKIFISVDNRLKSGMYSEACKNVRK